MEQPYAIEMLNITKRFPGIVANDNITLQLKKGEIHALLGENGAGKSTLMSVLFGLYRPEEGTIKKNGQVVEIKDPNDANDLGIGMVHQHFKLVECFTVLDNIILGVEPCKNGLLQNISSVASGGEIARVMLSVKAMIAGAVKLPTIVFDEIDTGVSGEIADRMADIMQEMGDHDRQVISITHLPQIAARGRAHYKVYKQDNDTETNSHIRLLGQEERVEELAHMLSGATLTEAALNNARALLGK